MAIILEAAYSKKLGLPNYSSHSYVVSIRAELQDINQVPAERANLYHILILVCRHLLDPKDRSSRKPIRDTALNSRLRDDVSITTAAKMPPVR